MIISTNQYTKLLPKEAVGAVSTEVCTVSSGIAPSYCSSATSVDCSTVLPVDSGSRWTSWSSRSYQEYSELQTSSSKKNGELEMSPGFGESLRSDSKATDKSSMLCCCCDSSCPSPVGGEAGGTESRLMGPRKEFHLRRRGDVDRCCCSCGDTGTSSSAHRIRTTLKNCELQLS